MSLITCVIVAGLVPPSVAAARLQSARYTALPVTSPSSVACNQTSQPPRLPPQRAASSAAAHATRRDATRPDATRRTAAESTTRSKPAGRFPPPEVVGGAFRPRGGETKAETVPRGAARPASGASLGFGRGKARGAVGWFLGGRGRRPPIDTSAAVATHVRNGSRVTDRLGWRRSLPRRKVGRRADEGQPVLPSAPTNQRASYQPGSRSRLPGFFRRRGRCQGRL
eukprot:scaffold225_cov388-Prasinococcus_capsulatus_cf.AAC.30